MEVEAECHACNMVNNQLSASFRQQAITMSSAADQARAAINLRTLQRIDKSIQSILDWAGYVVLYLHADGKWTKEGVEGSMFLYER